MIQTINLYQFREAFATMGRKDQFSYEGLESLFDHLEDYYHDGGEEHRLDVIALCCDYSEDTYQNISEAYKIDIDELNEVDAAEVVIEWLHDHTGVISCQNVGRILYCSAF